MLLILRDLLPLVIFGCILIKFFSLRLVAGAKDYRNLLVSLAAMVGYLFTTPTISFLNFRISELSIGFLLVAIGALAGKRLWSLIGALWFPLCSVAYLLMGQAYSASMVINDAVSLFLVGVVCYQSKACKEFSKVLWIAMLAVSLISKNWGINITLLTMIVWFSPKFEIKMPRFTAEPETTTQHTLGTEEKLAELENLQVLISSGAISKEEFETRKKQLLGLPFVYSAPTTSQDIGRCVVCGCENVPVENIDVMVAGTPRKRAMCTQCAAKYK